MLAGDCGAGKGGGNRATLTNGTRECYAVALECDECSQPRLSNTTPPFQVELGLFSSFTSCELDF